MVHWMNDAYAYNINQIENNAKNYIDTNTNSNQTN